MRRRSLLLLLLLITLALGIDASTVAAQTRPTPLAGTVHVLHTSAAQQDADADAVALAKRVLAGGDDAYAALLQALPEAGFTVIADDGSIAAAPSDAGQGLAFQQWEVTAMLASEGTFSTTLANAGQAFAGAIPDLAGAPLDQFLLEGLQDAVNSDNPDLRFWARFIAALGQQGQPASDLTTATDTSTVNLDAVQFALVMRRLAGDLEGFALQNGAAAPAAASARYLAARQSNAPCTLSTTDSTILDTNALVTGTAFGKFMDYLGEHLSEAGQAATEAIGKVTAWANLALAYAQLAWTAADFHADMQMEGSPPLVRTKQAKPATGELRQVDATVSLDLSKAQIANCLRPALNEMGLDFSLPNGGPVAGAEVRWYPGDGFDQQIVEFHDNPLYADNQADPGNPQPRETDTNGMASIGIEGVGQDEDLPDDVRPVIKPASVGIAVTLSPASLISTLETGAGAVAAGPAGLVALIPQLLQQSSWVYDGVYHFDVQDWQQVHYHGEGTTNFSVRTLDTRLGQETQQTTFSIDFDAPGDGKPINGTGTLTLKQSSTYNDGGSATCSDTETATYSIKVTGTEQNGSLKLLLALDGQPAPTCFLGSAPIGQNSGTFPAKPWPPGYVMLPDAAPDPSGNPAGIHVGTVAIDDKDGATVTLQYSVPVMYSTDTFADSGTFTLTLHQTDADQ